MVGGLVIWFQLQMNDTCLNLASIIRKIMITQSKKLRGSVSFFSSLFTFPSSRAAYPKALLLVSNGHRLGLHVGIPLVHMQWEKAEKRSGREKEEKERQREGRRYFLLPSGF